MTNELLEATTCTLNDLMAVCREAEESYRTALELVRDATLRRRLEGYVGERRAFSIQLQAAVRNLGGTPADASTLMDAVHRGWMVVHAAIEIGTVGAVLSACEHSEDIAIDRYMRALGTPLATPARDVVEAQAAAIHEARARIRELHDSVAQ